MKYIKKLGIIKKLFLSINVVCLLLNINLLFLYFLNIQKEYTIIFKQSDYININFFKKHYYDISTYLNNKFNINTKKVSKTRSSFKKTIKIQQVGMFNLTNNRNWIKSKLDDEFIIEFDSPDPDYLIFNVYNFYQDVNEDINPKYQKSIKIAIYTENIMTDMNYADYIFNHYHINYFDRYFKNSIFLSKNHSIINQVRKEVLKAPIRKKFCAAVISNCGKNYGFRLNFINKLSKYKKVDMGGRCRNNINGPVSDKIEFLSNYKFSIAMENSDGDGYLSEKIYDSFRSGTIPIYYGDYVIDEFINPKTYILIKGEKDIDEKIEYIKKIDNDIKLYKSIMKEKPIINEYFIDKIYNNEIKFFLKNIFKQDKNKAYRRDDNYYDYKC